jgi:hypothetical protein
LLKLEGITKPIERGTGIINVAISTSRRGFGVPQLG